MLAGLVSNIQKYSLQDGPGIRTTVFMKGCPLACAWCHNPENLARKPELAIYEGRCVRCGECLKVCPQEKGGAVPSEALVAPIGCTVCGQCVGVCPAGARTIIGREMKVDEVMREVLNDRVFYEDSGGGVTFSGGEPLVQWEFVKGVLQACGRNGIHAAIDTCGFAPQEHLLTIAGVTDLFLYDLKFLDDTLHREFTGVSNALILENLKALAEVHKAIWLRIPIIPGVNDAREELESMANFAGSLRSVRQVNLLPYHKTGVAKFKRAGKSYRLGEVNPPSPEYMEAAAEVFARVGLNVKVGG